MFYTIKYFATAERFSGVYFGNNNKKLFVNLNQISTISDLIDYSAPHSNEVEGTYAIITMENSDKFYIEEPEHTQLMEKLEADGALS